MPHSIYSKCYTASIQLSVWRNRCTGQRGQTPHVLFSLARVIFTCTRIWGPKPLKKLRWAAKLQKRISISHACKPDLDAFSRSSRTQLFQLSISYKPACLQKNFHGRLLSIWVFCWDRYSGLIVSLRGRLLSRRDQFKLIRIVENWMVNLIIKIVDSVN